MGAELVAPGVRQRSRPGGHEHLVQPRRPRRRHAGSLRCRAAEAPSITAYHRRVLFGRLNGLRQVCFQLGLLADPPPHPNSRPRSLGNHVAAIAQPEIRRVVERYLEVIATTLRPATVEDRADNLEQFGLWLADHHPEVVRLSQLDRPVMEEFLVWNRTRPSRGRRGRGQPVSTVRAHQGVATLKTFLDDLALWGWAERPARVIVHRSDLPRLPEAVPRALPPDVDRDLMAAVDHLDDVAARCGIPSCVARACASVS